MRVMRAGSAVVCLLEALRVSEALDERLTLLLREELTDREDD